MVEEPPKLLGVGRVAEDSVLEDDGARLLIFPNHDLRPPTFTPPPSPSSSIIAVPAVVHMRPPSTVVVVTVVCLFTGEEVNKDIQIPEEE